MKINSEIFDEYAKIALEEGLISEAEEKTNPRYDSLELSDIEILYGVKPNGEDDDILDKAHPAPMIIAPAYDRLNGLVENLKERSNVMKGIARKPNDGKLTQHRYVQANQELLDEVIKIGFMLDKNDQEDLMVLADSCSERIVKEAVLPVIAVVGIYAAVAALLGGGGAAMYTSNNPKTQGIRQDAQRTLTELDEVVSKEEYAPLIPVLAPLRKNIEALVTMSDSFVKANDYLTTELLKISSATTPEEKKKAIADNATSLFKSGKDKKIIEEFDKFKAVCDAVATSVPVTIKSLQEAPSKYEEAHSGFRMFFRSVKEFFLDSDTMDVIKMLQVLVTSCSTASATITENIDKINTLRDQVSQADLAPAGEEKPLGHEQDHAGVKPSAPKPTEDALQSYFKKR